MKVDLPLASFDADVVNDPILVQRRRRFQTLLAWQLTLLSKLCAFGLEARKAYVFPSPGGNAHLRAKVAYNKAIVGSWLWWRNALASMSVTRGTEIHSLDLLGR